MACVRDGVHDPDRARPYTRRVSNIILNGSKQPILQEEAPKLLRPPDRGTRMYRASDGSWWCLHPNGKQHCIHSGQQMRALGDG